MNAEDDPEARIRALEQPLSQQARASELGGAHAVSDAGYLPPPVSGYQPPGHQTPPWGAPPFGTSYGPPPNARAGLGWLWFGLISVAVLAVVAGIIVFVNRTPGEPRVSSGGGSIDIDIGSGPVAPSVENPDAPNVPAGPGVPGADVIVGAPGQTVTVSGIDENETIACNDATVSISGIRNTVNITGHCVRVAVSGIENTVTVDTVDSIAASGFDNKVTYHSGTPQIEANGSNAVTQG